MNPLRREIERLMDMECEEEAWDILMDHKYFDIDISCSSKTLEDYVGEWRLIGFEDETNILKEFGEKLKLFCNWVRKHNIKIECKPSMDEDIVYELFECDYSCSKREFIELWDKVFEKWVVSSGMITIKTIDELEEFAEKLISLYSSCSELKYELRP